jgi:hypothetical protein
MGKSSKHQHPSTREAPIFKFQTGGAGGWGLIFLAEFRRRRGNFKFQNPNFREYSSAKPQVTVTVMGRLDGEQLWRIAALRDGIAWMSGSGGWNWSGV